MKDYQVVESNNLATFQKNVNALLAQGYVPMGGVSKTNNGTYMQALARFIPPPPGLWCGPT